MNQFDYPLGRDFSIRSRRPQSLVRTLVCRQCVHLYINRQITDVRNRETVALDHVDERLALACVSDDAIDGESHGRANIWKMRHSV
jgi:hypothetical protein